MRRLRAQRPLPSMMIATWCGTAPWRRICASSSSGMLDLENLGLFGLQDVIDVLHVLVVELLDFLLGVLFLVFGDVLGFLDLADPLGARMPDGDAPLFREAMRHLH